MNPIQFVRSVYLGDRACKSIVIDSWAAEVKVQIDCISRVRGETWDFYNAEDLDDGFIVFEGVRKVEWDPNGLIPNDLIDDFTVEASADGTHYIFEMVVESVEKSSGRYTPVKFRVHAASIAL